MNNVSLISKLGDIETAELEYIKNDANRISLIGLRLKDERDELKMEYFLTRLIEMDDSIKIERKYPKLSLRFTDYDDIHYENLMYCLDHKFYLIEEPIKTRLTVIAKITSMCNLNCDYCFDRDYREKLSHAQVLPLEELDRFLEMASRYARTVEFSFHGGEPTLAGYDYVEYVCKSILPKYPYCSFDLSMQTNGLLINSRWKALLSKYNIQIGISYNAFSEKLRYKSGEEAKVLENILNLNDDENINVGVLEILTNENVKNAEKINRFYQANKIPHSLNLVYETLDKKQDTNLVELNGYLDYISKYFISWATDSNGTDSDRFASMYIQLLLTGYGEVCEHNGECVSESWLSINSNGDIFPCDRDVERSYLLLNISEAESIDDIFQSENYLRYKEERTEKTGKCRNCLIYDYCKGGCPIGDVVKNGNARIRNEYYCKLVEYNLLAAYIALSNVTIETASPILRRFLLLNNAILPQEVNTVLRCLGINKKKLNFEIRKSIRDENFKLFRALNEPIKAERLIKKTYRMTESNEITAGEDNRISNVVCALKKKYVSLSNENRNSPWSPSGVIIDGDRFLKKVESELYKNSNLTFSLYVHNPFCSKICSFCVYSEFCLGNKEDRKLYIEHISDVLPKQLEFLSRVASLKPIEYIYFGGGTASLLNSSSYIRIRDSIRGFNRIRSKEFEANPCHFNKDLRDQIVRDGFNRVSFGLQTFNRDIIEKTGREYVSPERMRNLIDYFRNNGIFVNVDLLTFINDEDSLRDLNNDLDILYELKPSGISVYPNYNVFANSKYAMQDKEIVEKTIAIRKILINQYEAKYSTEYYATDNAFELDRKRIIYQGPINYKFSRYDSPQNGPLYYSTGFINQNETDKSNQIVLAAPGVSRKGCYMYIPGSFYSYASYDPESRNKMKIEEWMKG